MNKRIISSWRRIVFTIFTTVILVFTASSLVYAQATYGDPQATYKVGDRAETMTAGKWYKVEIIEVKGDGSYNIRYLENGETVVTTAKWLRPVKSDAPTNNQNKAGNQVPKQSNGNPKATNGGGTAKRQQGSPIFDRFGSRDPQTCANQNAPARGPITAEMAKKYFICNSEYIGGDLLYLVENVQVTVGGGIPYSAIRGQRSLSEIDVSSPVYPIRGSLLRYQCREITGDAVLQGENCATYNEPKATGYCYKTTFGDWNCFMTDSAGVNKENVRTGVSPPQR